MKARRSGAICHAMHKARCVNYVHDRSSCICVMQGIRAATYDSCRIPRSDVCRLLQSFSYLPAVSLSRPMIVLGPGRRAVSPAPISSQRRRARMPFNRRFAGRILSPPSQEARTMIASAPHTGCSARPEVLPMRGRVIAACRHTAGCVLLTPLHVVCGCRCTSSRNAGIGGACCGLTRCSRQHAFPHPQMGLKMASAASCTGCPAALDQWSDCRSSLPSLIKLHCSQSLSCFSCLLRRNSVSAYARMRNR